MAELDSALYEGVVMHHRFTPQRHRFIYRVFSTCLDLDELDELDAKHRLFSVNRFNLFSLHEKDHGKGGDQLRKQITELLAAHGYTSASARIKLLCYPRILGYVFNPLSVYFCYNADDQLEVILYEVTNTFGNRHTYLLPATPDAAGPVRHHCGKKMYVSPFMPMDTAYSFRIQPPEERIAVCIRQTDGVMSDDASEHNHGQPILHATFTGTRTPFTDKTLLKAFLRYPLMTLKVITIIHWEALRLWRKKVKIQPRDAGNRYSVSWQDKNGVMHYESH